MFLFNSLWATYFKCRKTVCASIVYSKEQKDKLWPQFSWVFLGPRCDQSGSPKTNPASNQGTSPPRGSIRPPQYLTLSARLCFSHRHIWLCTDAAVRQCQAWYNQPLYLHCDLNVLSQLAGPCLPLHVCTICTNHEFGEQPPQPQSTPPFNPCRILLCAKGVHDHHHKRREIQQQLMSKRLGQQPQKYVYFWLQASCLKTLIIYIFMYLLFTLLRACAVWSAHGIFFGWWFCKDDS